MVWILQKQGVLPASPAAPSFVCVDVVVKSTLFLRHLYAQRLDQHVVHVVERIIGETSVVHQSLAGGNKGQVVVRSCFQRHSKAPKRKPSKEKHIHSLESHGEIEANPEAPLPDQLYFHTLSINQVTKGDSQAFVEVKVVSCQCTKQLLCKVDTGAEGNVISLSTYKSFFPGSPCNNDGIPTNLSSSTTIISAFGGHPVDHYGI